MINEARPIVSQAASRRTDSVLSTALYFFNCRPGRPVKALDCVQVARGQALVIFGLKKMMRTRQRKNQSFCKGLFLSNLPSG